MIDSKKFINNTDNNTTDNKIIIKHEDKININHEDGFTKVGIKDEKKNEIVDDLVYLRKQPLPPPERVRRKA